MVRSSPTHSGNTVFLRRKQTKDAIYANTQVQGESEDEGDWARGEIYIYINWIYIIYIYVFVSLQNTRWKNVVQRFKIYLFWNAKRIYMKKKCITILPMVCAFWYELQQPLQEIQRWTHLVISNGVKVCTVQRRYTTFQLCDWSASFLQCYSKSIAEWSFSSPSTESSLWLLSFKNGLSFLFYLSWDPHVDILYEPLFYMI